MGKTKIEWCDYTINPVKGKCPVACPYCYARRLYDRFKWNPTIRLDLDAFQPLRSVRQPSRVFVGSTIELFGDWIEHSWMMDILSLCESYKRAGHSFLFLTKYPENLIRWSPFPDNCWVGVTITSNNHKDSYIGDLAYVRVPVKFISFEPLLEWADLAEQRKILPDRLKRWGINWLIIGQQTPVSAKTQPKIKWVREIVKAADQAGIPVFLKDNLRPILPEEKPFYTFPWGNDPEAGITELRQEMPKVVANCPI